MFDAVTQISAMFDDDGKVFVNEGFSCAYLDESDDVGLHAGIDVVFVNGDGDARGLAYIRQAIGQCREVLAVKVGKIEFLGDVFVQLLFGGAPCAYDAYFFELGVFHAKRYPFLRADACIIGSSA